MKKRFLWVWLPVILLCMLLLPANVQAAEVTDSGTCGENLTWEIDDAGVLTVSGTGNMDFTGNPPWGKHKRNITKIVVEEGVTGIAVNAFGSCTALTVLELPDSLEFIDRHAFELCAALTDVHFGSKLAFIDENAFAGCTGLTRITIPDSVTEIGDSAFAGCTGLTKITIPDSVTKIGKNAFRRCTGLTSVELGDGITTIFSGSFALCTGLTRITIPDKVFVIQDGAFEACIQLKEVTLGSRVNHVGPMAFADCASLTSFELNNNFNFQVIDGVLYSPDGKTLIRCPEGLGGSFTVPKGVIHIGDYAFYSCDSLEAVTFRDSVTTIGSHAFLDCLSLNRVSFGTGLNTISDYAFRNCTGLTEIDFWGDAPMIAESAFFLVTATVRHPWGNETWTDAVKLPYGGELTWAAREPDCDHAWDGGTVVAPTCTEAGYIRYICQACTYVVTEQNADPTGHDLDSFITEPTCEAHGSVTYSCTTCGYTATSVIYARGHCYENGSCTACGGQAPEGLVANGVCDTGIFWMLDNTGLLTLEGEGVTPDWKASYSGSTVPWSDYRTQIKRVVIAHGITYLGTSAFEGCENLSEVMMGDTVAVIAESAFKNCYGLTRVNLGSGLTVIGNTAFYGCAKLTGITLLEGLTEIGERAFVACKSLRSVSIPDSVIQIGRRAFGQCTGLIYISLPGEPLTVYADVFYECTGLWHILYRNENRYFFGNAVHHIGDAVITQQRVEPQCATDGYIIYRCSECEDSHSVVLAAPGHTWKRATCTDPDTCKSCGETKGEPLGGEHSWGEGVVVQTPADDQPGVLQYTCSVCSETRLELMDDASQTPDTEKPADGTTVFILVIVAVVVVIAGAGLLIFLKQRRA